LSLCRKIPIMAMHVLDFVCVFGLLGRALCSSDVRLVDASGGLSSVGLLQVRTDTGFGTVCGANAAAADVICRSLGYVAGSVSTAPCGFYGGENMCGADGTPVAMSALKCTGAEWSVEECAWSAPTAACAGHAHDTIVYCTKTARGGGTPQGSLRLIASDGSPSVDGAGRPEVFLDSTWLPVCSSGTSAASAAVICKSMGFSGAKGSSKCTGSGCGSTPPGLSELACTGAEPNPLACPHEAGDDVFCAPSESLIIDCVGDGETQGRPSKEASPQLAM